MIYWWVILFSDKHEDMRSIPRIYKKSDAVSCVCNYAPLNAVLWPPHVLQHIYASFHIHVSTHSHVYVLAHDTVKHTHTWKIKPVGNNSRTDISRYTEVWRKSWNCGAYLRFSKILEGSLSAFWGNAKLFQSYRNSLF